MSSGEQIIAKVREALDLDSYRQQHWLKETSAEYLELVKKQSQDDPNGLSSGSTTWSCPPGPVSTSTTRRRSFTTTSSTTRSNNGQDAVYGLDIALMRLINIFKSAAKRYGTERRVILLHGPVGSSKSTIARLLKGGLEVYSRRPEGALYSLF